MLLHHYHHKTNRFFFFSFPPIAACLGGYHEKRLLADILDPYNTLERPVVNESDPLQLSFGLTLMQIIDVVSFYLHDGNELNRVMN
jgi:Neurotransmitter-gated ion-channel ligand binding domain